MWHANGTRLRSGGRTRENAVSAGREAKDIWSGLLFVAFGAAAIAIALIQGYEIGVARKMGPGYFPIWIGGILCVLGSVLAVRGFVRSGTAVGAIAWRPMFLVTAGTILFGAIVNWAGLFPATALLVLISAYASQKFTPVHGVLLALGLAAFSVLVFNIGLGVSLPIMPHVLGR